MSVRKLLFLIHFVLLQQAFIKAQDVGYPAFPIAANLSHNANAVIRKETTDIQVLSDDRMLVNKEKIITVLNSDGIRFADFIVFYTNFDIIKKIKITVFDASGKRIKTVKSSEIKDYPAENSYTLYDDTRVLYYRYISAKFPYTVGISYTENTQNTAFIPPFNPVKDFKLGIENSSYKISYPSGIKLHVKEQNLKSYHVEKQNKTGQLSYKLTAVQPILPEDFMPPLHTLVPKVKIALNRFTLAGVKGHADNWEELGNWIIERLLKGRNTVTEKTRNDIIALTKNIKNPVEKAKKVYQYMQDKTRYVSVQIGIGGWRPMPALEVDRKAYGDCKALVNYTKSLLDIAGVKSYYSIVFAGQKRNIDSDWVALQGNHVILMLPAHKDTIWLECTNQKTPFGHIAGFTDDRKVFVVKQNGSFIKKTAKYPDSINKIITRATIKVSPEMTMSAQINITHCGTAYDDVYPLKDLKPEKQKLYFKNYFSEINKLKINKIELKDLKDKACFKQHIDMEINHYIAQLSAQEYYFRPNIFTVFDNVPPKTANRRFPVVINHGFNHYDEIVWLLPNGYTPNYLPGDITINSELGQYSRQIIKKDIHTILYKRRFLMKSGMYPKENYPKFRKFLKKIRKLDSEKIILKKVL